MHLINISGKHGKATEPTGDILSVTKRQLRLRLWSVFTERRLCCCSQELVGAAKVVSDKSAAKAAPTSSDGNRWIKGTIRRRRRTAGVSWCLPAACKLVRWFQTNLLQKKQGKYMEEEVCRKVCFESWGWIIGEHFPLHLPHSPTWWWWVRSRWQWYFTWLYCYLWSGSVNHSIIQSFNQGSVLFCSSSDCQGGVKWSFLLTQYISQSGVAS